MVFIILVLDQNGNNWILILTHSAEHARPAVFAHLARMRTISSKLNINCSHKKKSLSVFRTVHQTAFNRTLTGRQTAFLQPGSYSP